MKKLFVGILFLVGCSLSFNCAKAQDKILGEGKYRHTLSDSLLSEFSSTVYDSFYNPSYMATTTSTFAMLKIDIDIAGKVKGITFSDSADSTFVQAFKNRKKRHDDKATLEKYAKLKMYKDVSLLIPVSFEPKLPNSDKHYTNSYFESYLRFNHEDFTGKAIILTPIFIPVLAKGER
ncbi:hypothetical protein LX99_03794 [Mucilaginibacter oryzae]|uniref:TonB-like protein n=1 Tax=Mucilaginibacter oryzae TaxID=468058 RepID=A0A316H5W6_9SPHI|nr:hypothetical protein [Mucilaginibacter oryzae]PWK75301.1 hypothetical protein LX99_03794 [Mucilaginibacter oryzae]